MAVLIFLFCVFYFILAWRRLNWAVLLLIAALPAYLVRFKILGVPFTLLEAMILISFAVWLWQNYQTIIIRIKRRLNWKSEIINQKLIKYPFGIGIILLLIISYLACFVAGFSNEALGIWKAYFFEPVLLFILVLNVFKQDCHRDDEGRGDLVGTGNNMGLLPPHQVRGRNDNLEKIIWALALGALTVSILAIYQKITGDLIGNPLWANAATRRVVSFFGYPNAVGLYLGPIVMVLVGYFFSVILIRPRAENNLMFSRTSHGILRYAQDDKSKLVFLGITILLSLLSIIFAKSIGAIVGLAVAFFVFGILAGKKWRWATLILTGVVIVGILSVPSIRTKAVSKVLFQDLSGQIRLQQWHETWQMMTQSPTRFIFGTGLSGYQQAIAPYHQEGIFFNSEREPWEDFHRKTVFNAEYRATHWQPVEIYMYPHDILLNFWTELGLAGAILFAWIVIKYFWIGISNFEFRISNQNLISNDSKLKNSKFIQNLKFKITKFYYLNIGLMGAMIVVVVHGIVDVPYFKNDLSILFWLLVAMISLINLEVRSKKLEIKKL